MCRAAELSVRAYDASMNKIVVVLLLGLGALAVIVGMQRRGAEQGTQPASVVASTAAVSTVVPVTPPPAPPPVVASDSAACGRLADLCSTTGQRVDAASCQTQLADARKLSGDANVARSAQCITQASTCAAAMGCIQGGVGMGALGEYLKGLGSALSH
jgi:hypothetical protein